MFERFTREARAVVKDAEVEAAALGSRTIEAEHLLLALSHQQPATVAGSVLRVVGLDYEGTRHALDSERERSLMAVGVAAADFDVPAAPFTGRPRFAASAKTALERALRASLQRNDRRIDAGHVLLGLLQAEAGTVPRALAQAGVQHDELRARLTGAMDAR